MCRVPDRIYPITACSVLCAAVEGSARPNAGCGWWLGWKMSELSVRDTSRQRTASSYRIKLKQLGTAVTADPANQATTSQAALKHKTMHNSVLAVASLAPPLTAHTPAHLNLQYNYYNSKLPVKWPRRQELSGRAGEVKLVCRSWAGSVNCSGALLLLRHLLTGTTLSNELCITEPIKYYRLEGGTW